MDHEQLIRELGDAIEKLLTWYRAEQAGANGKGLDVDTDALWADAMTAITFANADYQSYKQGV